MNSNPQRGGGSANNWPAEVSVTKEAELLPDEVGVREIVRRFNYNPRPGRTFNGGEDGAVQAAQTYAAAVTARLQSENASLKALLSRTPASEAVPAESLDWLKIAILAGKYGVRYRTNASFADFLSAISVSTPSVDAEASEVDALRGEVERLRSALANLVAGVDRMIGGDVWHEDGPVMAAARATLSHAEEGGK